MAVKEEKTNMDPIPVEKKMYPLAFEGYINPLKGTLEHVRVSRQFKNLPPHLRLTIYEEILLEILSEEGKETKARKMRKICPHISEHAIKRWFERSGAKYSKMKALMVIRRMMDESEEVYLKPGHKTEELVSHGFEKARFFCYGSWVMVVVNKTMATIHQNVKNKWRSEP